MTYPVEQSTFLSAIAEWTPPEGLSAQFADILTKPSTVMKAVYVFDLLKDTEEDIGQDGLKILLGAATLISNGSWWNRNTDADAVIAARESELAPAPGPETPSEPGPEE